MSIYHKNVFKKFWAQEIILFFKKRHHITFEKLLDFRAFRGLKNSENIIKLIFLKVLDLCFQTKITMLKDL